ncbi:hypothetical protein ACS0TY_007135 [Phlomoides rotata]
MSKFTCAEMKTSIDPLQKINKIVARKPTQKLILSNNLGFKNSTYLNKQRKDTALIIREATISGAGNSDESFVFTQEISPFSGIKGSFGDESF